MPQSKAAWEKWEIEVTRDLGANRVRCSGRLDIAKGDVKSDIFLVDCKCTGNAFYSLSREFWDTISMWAMNESREPVVAVRTADGDLVAMSDTCYFSIFGDGEKPADHISDKVVESKRLKPSMVADGDYIFSFGYSKVVLVGYDRFVEAVTE